MAATRTITNGQAWLRTLWAIVVAGTMGAGGSMGYLTIYDPRPDPYTATQARADLGEIRKEIFQLHEASAEAQRQRHEIALQVRGLPPPEWRERIRRLELNYERHIAGDHHHHGKE